MSSQRGGTGGRERGGRGRGGGGKGAGGGGQRPDAVRWECFNGHRLEKFEEDEDGFTCDICETDYELGDPAMTCEDCEFDVCLHCVNHPPAKEKMASLYAKHGPKKKDPSRPPRLYFSAHGDTCFAESSKCLIVRSPNLAPDSNDFLYYGQVDNFAGVYAMLNAYFGGAITGKRVSSQITYGEEGEINGVDFHGAREVAKTLNRNDFVVVIDVAGVVHTKPLVDADVASVARPKGLFTVEKAGYNPLLIELFITLFGEPELIDGKVNPKYAAAVADAASPYGPPVRYFLHNYCDDPVCDEDESDAYRPVVDNCFFLGVPTYAGKVAHPTTGESLVTNGDFNEGPVFCWRRDIDAVTTAVARFAKCMEDGLYDQLLVKHNGGGGLPNMKAEAKRRAAAAAS